MTLFTPLTGRCRCGQAQFRLEAPPIITHACHCRFCQQITSAPFRAVAMIETGHVTLFQGVTRIFEGEGSHRQIRCPDCGCMLWSHRPDLGEAITFVGLGLLDEGGRLEPEAHYFTRSKHPWITLPPDVPAFDQLGDPGKAGVRERILAALAAQGIAVTVPDWARPPSGA